MTWIQDRLQDLRQTFTRGEKQIPDADLPAVVEAVAEFLDRHTLVVPEVRVQRGRTIVTVTGRVDRPPSPFCDDGALVTAVRSLLRELDANTRPFGPSDSMVFRTERLEDLETRLRRYLETGRWDVAPVATPAGDKTDPVLLPTTPPKENA